MFDFTKKEDGELNYKIMDPSNFALITPSDINPEIQLGERIWIFELPIDCGGTLSNEDKKQVDSLMAFDITTGAEEA